MRRVSSRQRLVSWDAFDASAPGLDGDDDASDYRTASQRSSFSAPPDGALWVLDLEDEERRLRGRQPQVPPPPAPPAPRSRPSAPAAAVVGEKRDRSGAAAASASSSSSSPPSSGGGMKKSVSFSNLLTAASSGRRQVAPLPPSPPPPPSAAAASFSGGGMKKSVSFSDLPTTAPFGGGRQAAPLPPPPPPPPSSSEPRGSPAPGTPPFPTLTDLAGGGGAILPPPEEEFDDDYGKMPALSAVASVLLAERRSSAPLPPPKDGVKDDGDDYGMVPAVSAALAERSAPLPPLGDGAYNDDDDDDEEDDDDYGKAPAVSAAAFAPVTERSAPVPLLPGDDDYGRTPAFPSPGAARPVSPDPDAAVDGAGPPPPRNESEGSLGLRYMTPCPSAADFALHLPPPSPAEAEAEAVPLELMALMDDALLRVLSYLPASDLRRASEACRSLRRAVAGPAGRHLWIDMARERWPTLAGAAERAGGFGGVFLRDDSGIPAAGMAASSSGFRGGEGRGEDAEGWLPRPNLSVLLGLSAGRIPWRVDPCHHAATPRCAAEFRAFDFAPAAPGAEDGGTPTAATATAAAPTAPPRRPDPRARRAARELLARGGPIPAVQLAGPVGAGDRCVRSDVPLPRPERMRPSPDSAGAAPSSAVCVGCRGSGGIGGGGRARSGSLDSGRGSRGGPRRWTPRSPLSSSPTASLMEFLRRSARGGLCNTHKDGNGGRGTGPLRPFVSPYAASADGDGAVVIDLTPRFLAYFEVSVLPRDEAQEPPPPPEEATAAGRARPRAAGMRRLPPQPTLRRPHLHRHHHPRAPGLAMHHQLPIAHLHHPLIMPLPLQMPPIPVAPPPHPHPQLLPAPRAAGSSSSSSDCIAVGLSTSSFLAHRRMPGWDRHSYGYHGDDGGIFHSSGEMERIFGPTYGPGDTVGCGVDYLNGGIFFTLNGEFLGYAWTDLPAVRGTATGGGQVTELYPTVGVDSKCPVACNFGERPFAFDLGEFAWGRQNEAVTEALGGLVRGSGSDESSLSSKSSLRKMATL